MSSSEFSLNVQAARDEPVAHFGEARAVERDVVDGPVDGARVEIGMPTFFVHAA